MTPEPLADFSPYLASRHRVLVGIASEIINNLDGAEEASPERRRASDLMWLWTLGAYEVVRTMCQAQACFSPRFYREAAALKVALERVRVPSTKMERVRYDRREPAIPVPSDRAPDLWDGAARDLRVGDPADAASARALLAAYVRVLGSLTAEDVVMRHEALFAGRPR